MTGEPLDLVPANTALLIVDMQNDNLSPGGAASESGAVEHAREQDVVAHVRALAYAARAAGVPVFHNHFVVEPGAPGVGRNAPLFASISGGGMVVRGTWGATPVAGVEPRLGDFTLERARMSAFNGTQLDILLRNLGVSTVVVCGVWTNMAVEHTARDAADRGYRVVVVSDATSTINAEWQHAALNYALTNIATIATTEQVVAALQVAVQLAASKPG
ncbi:MAG: cysteine hydrolase [Thermomicrobiales bacterium]|nr:cysteine hydrolase [Thermomicrobiales bacterium]